jgi:hypothetical protein
MTRRRLALLALLTVAGGVRSQSEPAGTAAIGDLPPAIIKTLDALGATSGVPDGAGAMWEPRRPVAGQLTSLSLFTGQVGLTLPVWTSADEGVFATGSARGMFMRGGALYPETRQPFPNALYDVQVGGAFVQQVADGKSWGICLAGGSASDRLFNTVNEATVSAMAFWRSQVDADHAWLFYVVSITNAQVGQNRPIPGAAYEFHSGELEGVIGFPFLSLTYRPTEVLRFDLNYAAFTDIQARASVRVAEPVRLFTGFSWYSQSWLPADRPDYRLQLFWYEKRLEGGLTWAIREHFHFVLTGGYAFDRYFLEAHGFTLTGRNHLGLAPGPFVAAQLEIKY